MPISDLCSKNTVFVKTNDTLLYAAQLMKRHNVGCVVVVESTGKKKLAGILTDRDIAISVATLDKASLKKVKDFMSPKVVSIHKTAGIAEVVGKMQQESVRRLVVTDDNGITCGVVSADDLLQLLGNEMYGLGRLVGQQLEVEPSTRSQLM